MAKKRKKETAPCALEINPEIKNRNNAYVAFKKAKIKRLNAEKSGDETMARECLLQEKLLLDEFLKYEAKLPEKNRVWKNGIMDICTDNAGKQRRRVF